MVEKGMGKKEDTKKGEHTMRKKLKPELDLESVQSDLIETVCNSYTQGKSVRALAKQMEMSPMKVRKILITGNVYSTDLSTEIDALYKDGKTVGEIAELLNTTPANVNSYLPYERIIYNMEERSVEADRQARYRERMRFGDEKKEPAQPRVIERARTNTLVIVAGKKLRKLIPDVFDETSDPLARDRSTIMWMNGEMVEPADPNRMIWCAEVTVAGRGKGKKVGVVLMSANCGFAVISRLPALPDLCSLSTDGKDGALTWSEREKIEWENREKLKAYRATLEKMMIDAIRDGFLAFCLPEDRVLDYTDTVRNVELIKGRTSTPVARLEELIEQKLNWNAGDDPVERFNVRGNWTTRKFGNGDYRSVDIHTCDMLGLNEEEYKKWQWDFFAPMQESMKAGE